MEAQQLEDWVDILDTTNYAPHKDPDNLTIRGLGRYLRYNKLCTTQRP